MNQISTGWKSTGLSGRGKPVCGFITRPRFSTGLFLNKQRKNPSTGAGPGLFARYHPGMLNSDITNHDGVETVADVHDP